MFRLRNQLSNHCLDDSNVSVQGSTEDTSSEGNPDVVGKPKNNHRNHGPNASQQEDRFPANAITQTPPVHTHQGLRQGEGRDEQAGVGGCIFFVADLEALDKLPGIWKDRSESDGLGETDNSCLMLVRDYAQVVQGSFVPSRNSCRVGKSSGLRVDLWAVRVIASESWSQSYDSQHDTKADEREYKCKVKRRLWAANILLDRPFSRS